MYKRWFDGRFDISLSQETERTLINMKFIIVAAVALVAVAAALPVEENKPVAILRSEFQQEPEGGYVYSFETENGIKRQENGEVKEVLDEENKPRNVVVVRGSYTYVNNEGVEETINYVADENGYKAEGASIPVAPVARR
ncbi:unnamed protein product [Chrysodeixis includens]|uniref:Uncharacterized protein n=1 Tax=Chrysodeixis includens TaxID=689277 RepID=A0A9N8PY58_CHRIL|nr:unnamed protein product [Chrysodeixis includens]